MSLTYGFYNSLNGDRKYDAEQMGSIFDGIINDGIYQTIGDAMTVKASSGMSVNVSPGRAWFNHTWTVIDALYPVTLSAAPVGKSRYDAVILQINKGVIGRANTIEVIEGATAVEPAKPTVAHDEASKIYRYPLAYIYVGASVTAITQTNITNAVGESATPFVSGVLEHIDTGTLTTQWAAEFEEMITAKEANFNTLLEELKNQVAQATSQTVIDGSVTRVKLASDALYSPMATVTESRAFVADDLGKTLCPQETSDEATYILTLNAASSAVFPVGGEVAVCQLMENNYIRVSFSGVRVVAINEGMFADKSTTKTASIEQGGMFALKKIAASTDSGDLWLLTGSMDIS